MNHIEISGRMCRDPELKHIGAKGTKLANFSIALTMGEGQYKKAHFFDCKVWGERAVSVCENYRKGDAIELRGMLNQEVWDADGQKRSKVVIVVMDHRVPGERGEDAPQAERKPAARKPDPGAYVPQVPPMDDLQIPF